MTSKYLIVEKSKKRCKGTKKSANNKQLNENNDNFCDF